MFAHVCPVYIWVYRGGTTSCVRVTARVYVWWVEVEGGRSRNLGFDPVGFKGDGRGTVGTGFGSLYQRTFRAPPTPQEKGLSPLLSRQNKKFQTLSIWTLGKK